MVLGGGRGGLLQLLLAPAPAAGGRPAQRAQHRRRPLHHLVRLESHRSAFSGKYFEYRFDVVKIFFTQTYIQRYMANAINNPSIYKVTDYLTLSLSIVLFTGLAVVPGVGPAATAGPLLQGGERDTAPAPVAGLVRDLAKQFS